MKIKLNKIIISPFSIRDKIDEEYLNALMESLKKDGQWNPILVRQTQDGRYELIAGEYRVRAAIKLGWDEIEATIKDVNNLEASVLAIKTNIIRKSLDEIEEAKAVQQLIEKHNLTNTQAAAQLGVSTYWVSSRLALVMKIIKDVQDALIEDKISIEHTVLISRLTLEKAVYEEDVKVLKTFPDEKKQKIFLNIILERNLTRDESREVLKWIQNDTIYTIGYEGINLDEFIKILKENKIEVLFDIRRSGRSLYRPEFNEDLLARELARVKIEYERKPELGVINDIRVPYTDGWISHECFRQWYKWSVRGRKVNGEIRDLIPQIIREFKNRGKICLMCEERYPQPRGSQEHYCHRDILVDIILQHEDDEEQLIHFEKRVDL